TPRFAGTAPEPRPGMAAGHIPGAHNLPYSALYQADGTFRPASELRAAFARTGIDLARPVIATCGSGMTACVLIFALHLLGKEDVALYDGSWAEWGADPATPKETGIPKPQNA
ncbi:MAG TPA: rhodanese-like domain-containing protein, partial [Novosphingobium sp.]|nr:rhodanese-like domain-containing protein [Novosphingobium sp.]